MPTKRRWCAAYRQVRLGVDCSGGQPAPGDRSRCATQCAACAPPTPAYSSRHRYCPRILVCRRTAVRIMGTLPSQYTQRYASTDRSCSVADAEGDHLMLIVVARYVNIEKKRVVLLALAPLLVRARSVKERQPIVVGVAQEHRLFE